MNTDHGSFLVVIAGPTAVGKTTLSIRLARHFSTEIVSADSRQFYREMNIGTARPDAGQLSEIPHHFIGHLSVKDDYQVARFEADALDLLGRLFKKHRIVLLTGGSGLYIGSVCHGLDRMPDRDEAIRRHLRELLEQKGIEALQDKLKEADPLYYGQVDLNNPNRLIRALEVCQSTGIPYSSLRKNKPIKREFGMIRIGLDCDRKELYERIDHRVDRMMERGLLEEARQLMPLRHLNALNTVGYKELFDYFDGKCSLEEAVENIKKHTRHYAKRQLTWFRKQPEMKWFHPDQEQEIIQYIQRQLQKT